MSKITSSIFFAVALAFSMHTAPANAQATRTWVSGVGDDANPCSRTAPCKTFAGAISKTAAGGTIDCLDPGGFGGVTITKSILIDCSTVTAGVLVSGTNAVIVSGAGVHVVLRGLTIEGLGTGLSGIRFSQGASLTVEGCTIKQFNNAGIEFVPSGAAQLFVSDSVISFNGTSGVGGGGIFVDPGAGSALVTLQRVQLKRNFEGFRASGAGAGVVFANIQDTLVSANGSFGIIGASPAGGAAVFLDIQRTSSNLNGGAGIRASGAGVQVFIGSSMVTANDIGFSAVNGGAIFSFGNNAVDNNTSNGAATGPAGLM